MGAMYAERRILAPLTYHLTLSESETTAEPIQPKASAVDVAPVATVHWHGDECSCAFYHAERNNYPMAPSMTGYKIDMSGFKKHVDVANGQGDAQVCEGVITLHMSLILLLVCYTSHTKCSHSECVVCVCSVSHVVFSFG